MSHETFDPITRNIRAVEVESRQAIANAETAIASMQRRKSRKPNDNFGITVAAYQENFDKLGACLQSVNQAHDNVIAHAHLVADNIASRSTRNVLAIRKSLMETASEMLSLTSFNRTGLPKGVYDPGGAIDRITAALNKSGLLLENPSLDTFTLNHNQIGYIATFSLEKYMFSIVVTVAASSEGMNLGDGADSISVSVWENRVPPIWDSSYHEANSVPLPVGNAKGRNMGRWTRQTDAAIIDYVSSVLSKEIQIPTTGSRDAVPDTHMEYTNRYGTKIGRTAKKGSNKFDDSSVATILANAITASTKGNQGEMVLHLDPRVINKATLARYILDVIKQCATSEERSIVEGRVRLNREGGFYEIRFDSAKKMAPIINRALEGKF